LRQREIQQALYAQAVSVRQAIAAIDQDRRRPGLSRQPRRRHTHYPHNTTWAASSALRSRKASKQARAGFSAPSCSEAAASPDQVAQPGAHQHVVKLPIPVGQRMDGDACSDRRQRGGGIVERTP